PLIVEPIGTGSADRKPDPVRDKRGDGVNGRDPAIWQCPLDEPRHALQKIAPHKTHARGSVASRSRRPLKETNDWEAQPGQVFPTRKTAAQSRQSAAGANGPHWAGGRSLRCRGKNRSSASPFAPDGETEAVSRRSELWRSEPRGGYCYCSSSQT